MTNLSNIKPQGGDKKSFLKILNYKEYCSQSIIYRRKASDSLQMPKIHKLRQIPKILDGIPLHVLHPLLQKHCGLLAKETHDSCNQNLYKHPEMRL